MTETSPVEKIKEDGFTVLKAIYSRSEINRFKEDLENLTNHSSDHSDFIYNLHNKKVSFFTNIIRKTPIKSVLKECLNDEWYRQLPKEDANFILRGLVARSSGPSPLKMHIDSFIPSTGDFIWNMIVSVALDKTTAQNGATIIVPKSHKTGKWADQKALKNSITQCAEPGDVVIWDSRIWHAAGANLSEGSRWTINATFSRWWIKQTYDMAASFPKQFLSQLTNEEKAILGFCNQPPIDENDRINIQGGYELLS